jgi:hypothetical protein
MSWDNVRNSVVREDCEIENVNKWISNRKINCIEHIDRMDGSSLVIKVGYNDRPFGHYPTSSFLLKTTFWRLDSVSVLRQKPTLFGPIDRAILYLRRQRITLLVGPNRVGFCLRTETESILETLFLIKKLDDG